MIALLLAPQLAASVILGGAPAAPKTYFLTFGNKGYLKQVTALSSAANHTGLFDGIFAYTDFPDFITKDRKWSKHLNKGGTLPQGAGWWFWKAPLIKNALSTMDEGDVLLWADAVCELQNPKQFEEIAQQLCSYDVVAYSIHGHHKEVDNTKKKVFDEFRVKDSDPVYGGESPQIQTTYFAMKNTEGTRAFVQKWEELNSKIDLISDDECDDPSRKTCTSHKRDQSIFSMLVKASSAECKIHNVLDDKADGGVCEKHPTGTLNKRHGVSGVKILIAEDKGCPSKSKEGKLIESDAGGLFLGSRGRHLVVDEPAALKSDQVLAMKKKLTAC